MMTKLEVGIAAAIVVSVVLVVYASVGNYLGPTAKQIDARITLFKECMELAARIPRQADDDVSDIVSECSTQASYMTRHMK